MYKIHAIALALLACSTAGTAIAKERKIVDPLPASIVANNHIVAVEVHLSPSAFEKMAEFDKKASEKRTADHFAPVDETPVAPSPKQASSTDSTAEGQVIPASFTPPRALPRPAKTEYETLPFAKMFPLVMEDVTREWGLTSGRPIKLTVTVDTLKTANAAMAVLLSSADQLAGMVEVSDPVTNERLGSFYVDVLNNHGGLFGMAIRGGSVREKLSEEFALQTSRVLAGRKSKKAKKSLA